jgi:uncharacterized membrane protein
MATIHESIEVNAPVDACFDAWSNFENFPEFMAHVRDVRRVGDRETVWVTRVVGVRKEWRATTTTMDDNREIAWQADGDVGMDGRVRFSSVGPTRTRIDVDIAWKGEGLAERTGEALGIDDASVKRDLRNFQEYIEGRGTPARAGVRTGAMR